MDEFLINSILNGDEVELHMDIYQAFGRKRLYKGAKIKNIDTAGLDFEWYKQNIDSFQF